ncbi:putative glucarate transporter [Sporomusa acidovorans DSM 3132]|uniref:Glucarate transporter n=2 Tax=Sporomusa TaxID=2375 RepID=A0ABZ3J9G4_SPOA4
MDVNCAAAGTGKRSRIRWVILGMLFFLTTVNFADRAALSIAGPALSKDLKLDPVGMGYIFSAFAWAYVVGQLPGGWLLDRFGSKKVYAGSLFLWSFFTLLQGYVEIFSGFAAVIALFSLRFLVGLSESPSLPANSRIVASWFPTRERGTAAAIFNSAQYFATVLFAPIMGWIVYRFGWQHVFVVMGSIGIALVFVLLKVIHSPREHPRVNQAELAYIAQGGALVHMDEAGKGSKKCAGGSTWWCIKKLLGNRMLLGVYIGQYCITTLTYFFLTWFPIYLVQSRGMSILKVGFVAMLPALCGFLGGILGGVFSDFLLKRGHTLTVARKTPIVLGMLLSTSMIACNYIDIVWVVVGIMALAFFGKGLGALGWAVVADTSPKEIVGLSGGLFNTFGNTAGITTPILIGYIIRETGSFNGALVFVGANALGAILSYLLIVGTIKRMELDQPQAETAGQTQTS